MNTVPRLFIHQAFIVGLFFLVSCAPTVTFYVTKPPKLPVDNIETISFGLFVDSVGEEIQLPASARSKSFKNKDTANPEVSSFTANKEAADLVRGQLASALSQSNQYRILNSEANESVLSGVLPDSSTTAVVSATIKYSEHIFSKSESTFYSLTATREGSSLQEQLALMAAAKAASTFGRSSKKGFNVDIPYTETIAAMEVAFDLINEANGDKIIPTQVFRSYYVRKWGGKPERSHVPSPLRSIIVNQYQQDENQEQSFTAGLVELQEAFLDPDEFLAKGGKLKKNDAVPKNSLDISNRLTAAIVDQFVKQISRYTVETTLNVASGDSRAVTYIKGNAYDLAINRLENIERSEEDSFNLGLAYESVGEYRQALVYYEEALDKDPENELYQESISRVSR